MHYSKWCTQTFLWYSWWSIWESWYFCKVVWEFQPVFLPLLLLFRFTNIQSHWYQPSALSKLANASSCYVIRFLDFSQHWHKIVLLATYICIQSNPRLKDQIGASYLEDSHSIHNLLDYVTTRLILTLSTQKKINCKHWINIFVPETFFFLNITQ